MRRPTFLEGVAVALVASMSGSILFGALTTVFPVHGVLRLLIAGLGLAYVLYLLSRSGERVGRVLTLGLWGLTAAIGWIAAPPMELYVMLHCGLIWIIRSLYIYSGVLPALLDLGLNSLALSAAVWASVRSDSLFVIVWCFFLVQSLYVAVPSSMRRKRAKATAPVPREDRFHQAHRVAEAAIRRLASMD